MNAIIHNAKLSNCMSSRVVDCFVLTVEGRPVAALNAQGRTVLSGGRDGVCYEAQGTDNLKGWAASELAEDFKGLEVPKLVKWTIQN